ncbi:hypothetical protein V8F06_012028 [Rhypophila decipiens]
MGINAIRVASEHSIRAVLIALYDDSDVGDKALEYLERIEPEAFKRADNLPPPDSKRKATSGLAICVQCEESFDPEDNRVKECRYHNGELEPDHDADIWADHDENCQGEITADNFGKSHPEGFIWTCCEKPGDEEGCKLGRHQDDPERTNGIGMTASPRTKTRMK